MQPQYNTQIQPYKPDGAFSVPGIMAMLVGLGVSAVILGAAASYVSQWFYLIILFPVGIGLGLSFAAMAMVKASKMRNTAIVGSIALVAGFAAMTSMHFTDYLRYQQEMQAEIDANNELQQFATLTQEEIKNVLAELSGEDQAAVASLNKAMIAMNSFMAYMSFQADVGVSIKRARSNSSNGINLGRTGSMIYWGIEALIVAFIVLVSARKYASEPFCNSCNSWKTNKAIGMFRTSAEEVQNYLQNAKFKKLSTISATEDEPGHLMVTMSHCESCGEKAPFEMTLSELTVNKKNEMEESEIAKLTYPAGYYRTVNETFFEGEADKVITEEFEYAKTA